jgi:hypothetical protein
MKRAKRKNREDVVSWRGARRGLSKEVVGQSPD